MFEAIGNIDVANGLSQFMQPWWKRLTFPALAFSLENVFVHLIG